ncbi:MFS transporter [Streptomyces albiflaviniger]|nr:MFS transporter [Streptomyces albiflaviniger]
MAIGASYAISPTLLAEFAPRRHRGWMLASISAVWTVGYVTAFLVGYVMASLGDAAWRWMLASGAVPALIVILMRFGIPESPRWLFRKGRPDEALKVMRDHIDPNATLADLELDANQGTDYRSLFRKGLRGRVAFGGFFWCCQVVPRVLPRTGGHDRTARPVGERTGSRSHRPVRGLLLHHLRRGGTVRGVPQRNVPHGRAGVGRGACHRPEPYRGGRWRHVATARRLRLATGRRRTTSRSASGDRSASTW